MSDPITGTQLTELQRTIRNRGVAGREIHNYIHAALNGDLNARHFCAGVWKARHADKAEPTGRLDPSRTIIGLRARKFK